MTFDQNPRYNNYARVNGRTPDEQHEYDRTRWPGGIMCGFVLWNRARLVEASFAIPHAFYLGNLTDHAAYDAFLDALSVGHGVEPGEAKCTT